MTKKLLLPALVLICTALFATNSSAQTCSGFTGVNVQYMGVGSSAQFNTFSYAAEALIAAETAPNNVINFWATSSFPLLDNRANVTDTAKVWVAWDNASDCTVYAYFSVDSTVGVKSFFSWQKETNVFATNFVTAGSFGQPGTTVSACSGVVNAGQPTCQTNGAPASTTLPSGILTFLTTQPHPTCSTSCTGNERKVPLPYCGQNGTSATTTKWCFFNAGHSDTRPEDALYATTRALSAYNSTNGLSGLGYGSTGCGATPPNEGCPIYEAFGQGGVFNVENFKLSGTDPISGAALPAYVTLPIGAAPLVVLVNDADSTGFGAGAPSSYSITNINRNILAGFYNGTFSCTGDVLPNTIPPTFSGAGQPVQVVMRELLSGTYNTFEFTAVRIMPGSAATAVAESKASSITWFTNDDAGQENNNNPSANLSTSNCGWNEVPPFPKGVNPTAICSNPVFLPTGACGSNGNGIRLRSVGSGEEVKATLDLETKVDGTNNQSVSSVKTPDGLGYAFWSYGNFAPAATGCSTVPVTGADTCSGYLGHYLTVDGIDPLFTNPGDSTNPNGAYHLPQCYLTSGQPNCFPIPFTHVYDGSYPLWGILHAITFANVAGGSGQTTPASVIKVIAEAEKAAGGASSVVQNLSDFVPYYNNIDSTDSFGDLNLGVFRSHYKQTNNPLNGYLVGASPLCNSTFTHIALTPAAGACTVDVGGDVGGAVFTVQSDVDFNADFGSTALGTQGATKELYGLHQ